LKNSSKNSWWTYLYLKEKKFLLVVLFFNIILTAILGYLTPGVITDFYNSIQDDVSYQHFFTLLALLVGFEYLNRFFFQIAVHLYIRDLLNHVRVQSFSLWLKAPFRKRKNVKHDEYPMGEVLARIMSDTDAIKEIVTSGAFGVFIDVIFVASCLISFLKLNSTTGLGLFIAEVVACILLVKGSRAMAGIFMEVRKIQGQMARVVTDLTSGLKELFFTPHQNYAVRRGEGVFEKFLTTQLRANIWDASYYSAAESLYPILIALVMILVPHSQIVEVAILAALIDLIQRSIMPIKEIAAKISVITRGRTGIERIHQFNESFERVAAGQNYHTLSAQELNLKLDRFQYDQGFTLNDISFQLQRGQILGLLGESGCGKSTLLKLLSGQYYSFEGCVKIDQDNFNPHREEDLKSFSNYVSLVSQDSHVFSESLKFNIGLGYVEGFDEFWELAKKSISYLGRWGLTPDDLINPKQMSMGQKQLISGLRAMYLKKPVILMDEISSGLDSDLESALKDLIHFFRSQTMTIIVTHRLETILNSDQLILMDQGRMVGQGSYEQLKTVPKFNEFLAHLDA
jgi:ATP-binding cassette subfamily B protein